MRTKLAIFYTIFVVSFSAWVWSLSVPPPAPPTTEELRIGLTDSPLPEILMPRLEKQGIFAGRP